VSLADPRPARRNVARIFWLETRFEFLKNLRLPIFALSTLMFPVMFYIFFGLTFAQGDFGAISAALYYAIAYGAFGVIGASLFGFGVGVATERGQGWMRLKRASPMPPLAYFVAKIGMSMLFGLIIVLTLLLLSVLIGGARPDAMLTLRAVLVLVAGALPFGALGLTLGYLVGPNSAPAIVNLIYLPMAFVSGLWIPIQALPELLQKIAVTLPTYHFAQLAFSIFGVNQQQSVVGHIVYLGIFTAVFVALAIVFYFRDEGQTFG
jgi:ABC-2 type transport system permease protein